MVHAMPVVAYRAGDQALTGLFAAQPIRISPKTRDERP